MGDMKFGVKFSDWVMVTEGKLTTRRGLATKQT